MERGSGQNLKRAKMQGGNSVISSSPNKNNIDIDIDIACKFCAATATTSPQKASGSTG